MGIEREAMVDAKLDVADPKYGNIEGDDKVKLIIYS